MIQALFHLRYHNGLSINFTFVVKVLFKKIKVSKTWNLLEVVMIKERHGKQGTLPNIIHNESNDDLPPLVTISSKKRSSMCSKEKFIV